MSLYRAVIISTWRTIVYKVYRLAGGKDLYVFIRQVLLLNIYLGCPGSSLQHRFFFSCIDWGSSLVAMCRPIAGASLGAEGF